jgi:hypothetical protein
MSGRFGRKRVLPAWLALAAAVCVFAALPAASHASTLKNGGGPVAGTLTYGGEGVPRLLGGCSARQPVTVELSSPAFAIRTQVGEYVGPIDISIVGESRCESFGGGGIPFNGGVIEGENPLGNRVRCELFDRNSGSIIRTHNTATIGFAVRSCDIDGARTIPFHFVGGLTFVPDGLAQGASLTAPTMSAQLTGALKHALQ